MKNPFLKFVMAATFVAVVAAGCGSTEKAGGSDTTATDSSTMMSDTTAAPMPVDTGGATDTTRTDTTIKM